MPAAKAQMFHGCLSQAPSVHRPLSKNSTSVLLCCLHSGLGGPRGSPLHPSSVSGDPHSPRRRGLRRLHPDCQPQSWRPTRGLWHQVGHPCFAGTSTQNECPAPCLLPDDHSGGTLSCNDDADPQGVTCSLHQLHQAASWTDKLCMQFEGRRQSLCIGLYHANLDIRKVCIWLCSIHSHVQVQL